MLICFPKWADSLDSNCQVSTPVFPVDIPELDTLSVGTLM
jgi:hypothetical protein